MDALIKVAKHDQRQLYVENSATNIQKIRTMSNMALALSRDVLRDMEHFRVVIQPVVSTKTGQVVGGEALLRWRLRTRICRPLFSFPCWRRKT